MPETTPQLERCPYLVEVTMDWIWLYRNGCFCRRPDGRIRVPSPRMVATRCDDERFRECDGFRNAAKNGGDDGA